MNIDSSKENMKLTEEQRCIACGGVFTLKGILDKAEFYWSELDLVICKSPCCRSSEELQLKNGQISRGYVYAAGSPHYEAMDLYKIPGLEVLKSNDSVTYKLNGKEVVVKAKS